MSRHRSLSPVSVLFTFFVVGAIAAAPFSSPALAREEVSRRSDGRDAWRWSERTASRSRALETTGTPSSEQASLPSQLVIEPPEELSGLLEGALVARDADGIPHLFALNERDLYFVQGWVHASDRLFQMDLTRRQISGTLSEMLGPSQLGSDVQARTIGMRRAAVRSLEALSSETRAALVAYAKGVNAWVARHTLPLEYGLLELSGFEPWTPVDSVVIGKAIAFSLSFDLDIELTQRLAAYQAAGMAGGFDGLALFSQDVFRSAPFDPASTVPDATATSGLSSMNPFGLPAQGPPIGTQLSPETIELAGKYLERARQVPMLRSALSPRERIAGSNEWAVSGALTQSGRPLIANDPHLSLGTPATFYQMHLSAGRELDVIGSSFAGVPFIVLGQNPFVTWGATTNPLDVTDTYQEKIVFDPSSQSMLSTIYLGQPEHVIPLPQLYRYNSFDGQFDNLIDAPPGGTVGNIDIPAATLIVPRRNMGPIVALDVDPQTGSGFALSVQYTGFSATRELDTFRLWNKARNLDDFRAGLQLFDFGSQNWVYGDIEGNIAYFTSAELPLREDLQANTVNGLPPYFIRNGTGGNEWLALSDSQPGQAVPYEILPFGEMPQVINPPAGWFVNANNDPAGTTLDNDPLNQLRPGGGLYYLNPGYAIGTRAGRITQALRERLAAGPVTADDMAAIQADVVLLDAQAFVPYILAAFDHAGASGADPALAVFAAEARIAEAVGRLANWNYTTPTGVDQGYDASDVAGATSPPDDDEIAASIAATIFSVWRGQMIRNTVDVTLSRLGLDGPGSSQAMTALRNLLDSFETQLGFGVSGVDFIKGPEGASLPADRIARRDALILQSLADALDLLADEPFAPAFDFSTSQDDYRWGRLHRIVFRHPLGGMLSVPPAGGAFPPPFDDLPGVPVDGGFGVVDASSHSSRAANAGAFMYGGGPVRRYVGQPGTTRGSIDGQTALPGGSSGDVTSPFYFNLLGRWLTNDAHPVRQSVGAIAADLYQVEVFIPYAGYRLPVDVSPARRNRSPR
ncbi:MAG: penicillin acylase family protein [Acidobacteriota bacterium]|nr:MAG: penicillin acylase family protein [Acidobacteriota bacterium]